MWHRSGYGTAENPQRYKWRQTRDPLMHKVCRRNLHSKPSIPRKIPGCFPPSFPRTCAANACGHSTSNTRKSSQQVTFLPHQISQHTTCLDISHGKNRSVLSAAWIRRNGESPLPMGIWASRNEEQQAQKSPSRAQAPNGQHPTPAVAGFELRRRALQALKSGFVGP